MTAQESIGRLKSVPVRQAFKNEIQMTGSDHGDHHRTTLEQTKKAKREEPASDGVISRIKQAIQEKIDRYQGDCRSLVLVLDAWPALMEKDIDEFLGCESQFVCSAPFQDMWIVSPHVFVRRLNVDGRGWACPTQYVGEERKSGSGAGGRVDVSRASGGPSGHGPRPAPMCRRGSEARKGATAGLGGAGRASRRTSTLTGPAPHTHA